MSAKTFSFLHAGAWRLDKAVRGRLDIPPHLEELLLEAPRRAAARAIQLALHEGVNFVVLCGNLLHPERALPEEWEFLTEQFGRLEREKIRVFWAADRPMELPGNISPPWPPNVTLFPANAVREELVEQAGAPICRILGRSGSFGPFPWDEVPKQSGDVFTVGMLGSLSKDDVARPLGVDYLATASSRGPLAQHTPIPAERAGKCGSTTTRLGPRRCALVRVSQGQVASTRWIGVDEVRWMRRRLEVSPATTPSSLEERLREQIAAARAAEPETSFFVHWKLAGPDNAVGRLVDSKRLGGMLEVLRSEYGHTIPVVWPVAIEPAARDAQGPPPVSEESFLDECIRALRRASCDETTWPELNQLSELAGATPPFGWPPKGMRRRRAIAGQAEAMVRLLLRQDPEQRR